MATGWQVQETWREQRYTAQDRPGAPVNVWARDLRDARLGLAGFYQQYPLYGVDLSNHVEDVLIDGPRGSFSLAATCRDWRAAVNAGRFDYLVTAPRAYPFDTTRNVPEAAWTASDPATEQILSDESGPVTVFALRGPLDPAGCPPEPG